MNETITLDHVEWCGTTLMIDPPISVTISKEGALYVATCVYGRIESGDRELLSNWIDEWIYDTWAECFYAMKDESRLKPETLELKRSVLSRIHELEG